MDRERHHTDLDGIKHTYRGLFDWHCIIHDQVCDPFRPITTDDLLTLAARDSDLDDDAFVLIAQAAEGRGHEPTPPAGREWRASP